MRKVAMMTLAALALSAVGIDDATAARRVSPASRTQVRRTKSQTDFPAPSPLDPTAPGLTPNTPPGIVPDTHDNTMAPEYPARPDTGMPSPDLHGLPPGPYGGYSEAAPAFTVIRQDLPYPDDNAPYRQSMIEVRTPPDAKAMIDGKDMDMKGGVFIHAPKNALLPGVPYKHDITVQRLSESGVTASRTVTIYMRMGRKTELVFE